MEPEPIPRKRPRQDSGSDPHPRHTTFHGSFSAVNNSRQHIGHNYNAVNLNFTDDDGKRAEKIIESLHFPEVDQRQDSIAHAARETFEWLLDSDVALEDELVAREQAASIRLHSLGGYGWGQEWKKPREELQRHLLRVEAATELQKWLRHGNGVFWVSGQAASGKSTLMKFTYNSDTTHHLLREWAGRSPLSVASHYFWHSGSSLEKSHEGLYRALLLRVFRENPQLIKVACPDRWNSEGFATRPWCDRDFKNGIASLGKRGVHICLFIDGLDEYHPQCDQSLLVETLQDLSRIRNIKICASSRPWPLFLDSFGNTTTKLTLQDINWIDIERFVIMRLRHSAVRSTLKVDLDDPLSDEAAEFIENVVRRSNGVFLWAFLVMQRLGPRLRFARTFSELEKFLSSFPRELEAYFRDLVFERTDPAWRESSQAAAILAFRNAGCDELRQYWPVLTENALEDPRFGYNQPICFQPLEWFVSETQRLAEFITACCPDLLITVPAHSENDDRMFSFEAKTVQFTHQTVADVMATENMQSLLKAHTPQHFGHSADIATQARLVTCKVLPADADSAGSVLLGLLSKLVKLLNPPLPTDNDLQLIEECESIMVEVLRPSGHDSKCSLGLSLPQTLSSVDLLDPDEALKASSYLRDLVSLFSSCGLFRLIKILEDANCMHHTYLAAILEESLDVRHYGHHSSVLAVSNGFPGTFPETRSFSPGTEPDIARPQGAFSDLADPNPFSRPLRDLDNVRHSSTPSAWNQYLFRWWQSDSRLNWARMEFNLPTKQNLLTALSGHRDRRLETPTEHGS